MDLSAALYSMPFIFRLLTSGLWRRAELHPGGYMEWAANEAKPVRRLEGRKPSQLEQTRPAEPVNFLARHGAKGIRGCGKNSFPEQLND